MVGNGSRREFALGTESPDPQGSAVRIPLYGTGCCRFDGWNDTYPAPARVAQGTLTLEDCETLCLADPRCQAFDMDDYNAHTSECALYFHDPNTAMPNFTTGSYLPTPATHAILTQLEAGECVRHSI